MQTEYASDPIAEHDVEREAEALGDPDIAEAPLPDSPLEEQRREIAEAVIEQREAATRRDFRPASPLAVTAAIEEVNRVITSLKQIAEQMEEVLETLELAEVQKTADEREIESLRRALRQVDQPYRAPISQAPPRHGAGHEQPRREESRRDERREQGGERGDRGRGRGDRGNRGDRGDRGQRPPGNRGDRGDRGERPPRPERPPQPEQQREPERSDSPARESSDPGDRGEFQGS